MKKRNTHLLLLMLITPLFGGCAKMGCGLVCETKGAVGVIADTAKKAAICVIPLSNPNVCYDQMIHGTTRKGWLAKLSTRILHLEKMPLGEWEVVEVRGPSKPYCRDTEKDHQVLRLKFAAARLVTEGECRYGRQAETSLHVYKMVNVEHYGQVVWYTNDYDLEEGQVVKENRNHFINLNRKPW